MTDRTDLSPAELATSPLPDRAARIRAALAAAFKPTMIDVVDDSARHAGHAGARQLARGPGGAAGQTHYNVLVVSTRFDGLSRVERHRLVNDALAAEFSGGLHALSLTLRTPVEAAAASTGGYQRG